MAEPKKRLTSSRSGNRQSQDRLSKISLSNCPQCKENKRPHEVCRFCGFYNGEEVVKKDKKTAKE